MATTMKQRFLVTNIGLLTSGTPGTAPMAVPASDQQGVSLTVTPIPLDPSSPTPAGVGPVQIPFLDPAAKDFFTVGSVVEFVVTAPTSGS